MKNKILVCEDEKEVRELLKDILERKECEVYIAEDGKEAVDKTRELKPDLILLDIRMPKLNGLEAAKEIREFDKKVKIIFITGFQSLEITKEAAKYDIFDYINKPTSTQNLLETIQNALKQ